MTFDLMLFSGGLLEKQAVSEIIKCNEITLRYGLVLSEQQARELAETRKDSLKSSGRIEFGGGVIDKLILEFCDSPYIFQSNYTEVMHELIEIFYYYKNETLDLMSDDELISFMKSCFDGKCQGSLDLLKMRELERMARNIRFGYDPGHRDEEDAEEDEDEQY
ncbi:hypothetical protein DFR58_103127 [Anaerobacterium chartisolvens]|uniref:Uncharacterized protein n=1 Tax=Anaerobacterium chartisolvens TaxID=1297424 RepID=A0A369BCV0_9FIRM|nr:DUF6323 family protein [Anaerobacterium chartisolvens]RCX19382.1 hypothetical protein DFR58_103127 [Anaerobacterium chartisolvens]